MKKSYGCYTPMLSDMLDDLATRGGTFIVDMSPHAGETNRMRQLIWNAGMRRRLPLSVISLAGNRFRVSLADRQPVPVRPDVRKIVEIVARECGVAVEELEGGKGIHRVSRPRCIAAVLCRTTLTPTPTWRQIEDAMGYPSNIAPSASRWVEPKLPEDRELLERCAERVRASSDSEAVGCLEGGRENFPH